MSELEIDYPILPAKCVYSDIVAVFFKYYKEFCLNENSKTFDQNLIEQLFQEALQNIQCLHANNMYGHPSDGDNLYTVLDLMVSVVNKFSTLIELKKQLNVTVNINYDPNDTPPDQLKVIQKLDELDFWNY